MSKLSQAKTDLNFLKNRIVEITDAINNPWYDEYSKRDLGTVPKLNPIL